jgi:hypothetical protein
VQSLSVFLVTVATTLRIRFEALAGQGGSQIICETVKYNIHHINVKICHWQIHEQSSTVPTIASGQHFPGGQTIGSTCNCHTLQDLCKVWNVDYDENVCEIPKSSMHKRGGIGTMIPTCWGDLQEVDPRPG